MQHELDPAVDNIRGVHNVEVEGLDPDKIEIYEEDLVPEQVEDEEDENKVDEPDPSPTADPVHVSTPWRKIGRPRKGFEMDLKNESKFINPILGSDGKTTYQCVECSATFPRKWSITMHVRSHTKVKNRCGI